MKTKSKTVNRNVWEMHYSPAFSPERGLWVGTSWGRQRERESARTWAVSLERCKDTDWSKVAQYQKVTKKWTMNCVLMVMIFFLNSFPKNVFNCCHNNRLSNFFQHWRNVYFAPDKDIIMIYEGSCDTEVIAAEFFPPLHYILKYFKIENRYFK